MLLRVKVPGKGFVNLFSEALMLENLPTAKMEPLVNGGFDVKAVTDMDDPTQYRLVGIYNGAEQTLSYVNKETMDVLIKVGMEADNLLNSKPEHEIKLLIPYYKANGRLDLSVALEQKLAVRKQVVEDGFKNAMQTVANCDSPRGLWKLHALQEQYAQNCKAVGDTVNEANWKNLDTAVTLPKFNLLLAERNKELSGKEWHDKLVSKHNLAERQQLREELLDTFTKLLDKGYDNELKEMMKAIAEVQKACKL